MVAHHPNSHVYSQLQSLVDFEGFYLESEPCLVCNDPEVPYAVSQIVLALCKDVMVNACHGKPLQYNLCTVHHSKPNSVVMP